jgi:Cu-Zn family superoxide dismutase
MRSGIQGEWLRLGVSFAVAACLVVAAAAVAETQQRKAVAVISGCTDPGITGMVTLIEKPSEEGLKEVEVHVVVKGLAAGKHGVHLHENAACTPCASAGGHFDPGPNGNSSPDGNHPFHSGDLPNLVANAGVGLLHATTTRVTLSPGPLSLFDASGSAIIVHVNEDTYCPDGPDAGCAGGGRAACGIIEPAD